MKKKKENAINKKQKKPKYYFKTESFYSKMIQRGGCC